MIRIRVEKTDEKTLRRKVIEREQTATFNAIMPRHANMDKEIISLCCFIRTASSAIL
jgi:hypothetical protein